MVEKENFPSTHLFFSMKWRLFAIFSLLSIQISAQKINNGRCYAMNLVESDISDTLYETKKFRGLSPSLIEFSNFNQVGIDSISVDISLEGQFSQVEVRISALSELERNLFQRLFNSRKYFYASSSQYFGILSETRPLRVVIHKSQGLIIWEDYCCGEIRAEFFKWD
mgnify:CR=1 FL=1